MTAESLPTPAPEDWQHFGTHAGDSPVPPLEFSVEVGEDGLPLWERLLPTPAPTPAPEPLPDLREGDLVDVTFRGRVQESSNALTVVFDAPADYKPGLWHEEGIVFAETPPTGQMHLLPEVFSVRLAPVVPRHAD